MQITILNVTVESKGKYKVAEVAYKDGDGKVSGKKVMSFVNPPVFETMTKAQAGEVYTLVTEKDDKGYWQWTQATKEAAGTVAKDTPPFKTGAVASPKSTYETPEERAQKQVYIIRQSSLSTAVAFYEQAKGAKTPDDVIKVAKQFEAYVFGETFDDGTINGLVEDVV